MARLHPQQKRLLRLLKNHADDPLTVREIRDELNMSSTSLVAYHISQLEKRGLLKRNPYNPQDYMVLDEPERSVTYLNLYGLVQCGPEGLFQDDNVIDRIPVSSKLLSFSRDEAFLVKARGDSMLPLIKGGDLVIARRSSSAENEIAVCVHNGMAMIKRVMRADGTFILESLNKDSRFSPMIADQNTHIQGVVKGIITSVA